MENTEPKLYRITLDLIIECEDLAQAKAVAKVYHDHLMQTGADADLPAPETSSHSATPFEVTR